MSDSKVFMFPDSVASGASNHTLDPNLLFSMMNNNNGSFGGGGGGWMWVIFLFFLYGWGRNGMFGNSGSGIENQLNNDSGRELLMQAIQGNNNALQNLSNMLNTSSDSISAAIASVNTAVSNVGNTVGLTGQQVINSIQQGNMSLAQQLCSCCCENKQLVTQMGYEGLIRDLLNTAAVTNRIDQLSNGVQQGFASTAYETQSQTNALNFNLQNLTLALKDTACANTNAILAKLDQMTTDGMLDKINTLTAQLTAANSRAERQAELQPIINQLNSIKAAQPSTVAVQYPQLTAYPSYLNAAAYNSVYGSSTPGFWN